MNTQHAVSKNGSPPEAPARPPRRTGGDGAARSTASLNDLSRLRDHQKTISKRSRVMNTTQFLGRGFAALVAVFLLFATAFGQNLNLLGSGATFGGTWNVKGNISNSTATGTYTFSGTMNLNGTTSVQDVGNHATNALVFGTLNATGSTNKNQGAPVTVNTAFTLNNGATNSYVVGANTLNFGGTTTVTTGSFDASHASSVVNYTSGSAQTVLASTYGGTLGLWGAGAKNLGGVTSAALVSHTAASGALTVSENLTISGTSASSLDAISVASAKILDVTGTGGATIANVSSNAGTIRKTTAGGTITFSQAALTNAGTITASIGTLTFSGDVTNSGASAVLSLTGTGVANFAEDLINAGGGTLTFSNSGTQVNYTGSVAQSVASATYHTLAMSGAGVKTAAGNVTIAAGGSFNNGSATTDMDTYTLSGPGLTQGAGGTMRFGGATNGVVFSTGTVEYNGGDAVTQTITAGTYATLVLSRKSGTGAAAKQIATGATVTTTGNMSVPSTVSLTLMDAASALTVGSDLNVAGAITNNGTITVGS